MGEKCLHCGRQIEGPVVETPDGDTYHYACVEVEYPEPCMTGDALGVLAPEVGEETLEFFKYLQENPYDPIDEDEPLDSFPEVNVRVKCPVTIDICLFGHELSWNVYHKEKSFDISPVLFQAVYFGSALEREFPAFADEDELYPNGDSRVVDKE